MSLTREQAAQELRRRGLPIPGEEPQEEGSTQYNSEQPLPREEVIAELKRRGLPVPGEENNSSSYMDRIATSLDENIPGLGKFAETVNPYLQGFHDTMKNDVVPLAAHAAEGLLNVPISVGNILPGVNIPHLDYAKHTHPNRETSVPEHIADFVGGLGPYGKAVKGVEKASQFAGKALPAAKNILGDSKFAKYFTDIMKKTGTAGGAGYLLGERKGEEGDYLGSGRVAGGALGSVFGAASGGINAAKNYFKSISPESIVGNVLKKRDDLYKAAEKVYNKVNTAADNGALPVKIPKKLQLDNPSRSSNEVSKYLTKEERAVVKELSKKGDYDSAHKLQTILREASSRYPKKITTHRQARNTIDKTREKLVKSIDKSLKKKGGSDLVNEYKSASNKYTDYLEYDTKPFKDYLSGGTKKQGSLTKERFIEALKSNREFEKNQLKKFPEIGERDIVQKHGPTIAKVLGIGTVAGAVPSIAKYLFGNDEK